MARDNDGLLLDAFKELGTRRLVANWVEIRMGNGLVYSETLFGVVLNGREE